jgi:3'-5' exoribonuclease
MPAPSIARDPNAPITIKHLDPRHPVCGTLLVRSVGTAKRQNDLVTDLVFEFADASGGTIRGRKFNVAATEVGQYPEGAVVTVRGSAKVFNKALSLTVEHVAVNAGADAAAFEPGPRTPIAEHLAAFQSFRARVRNPACADLWDAVFTGEVWERFTRWPASARNHEATRHGLIEHTAHILHLGVRVAELRPDVDVSIFLTGGAMHDVGKVWELDPDGRYTTDGKLVGHIVLGYQHVTDVGRRIGTPAQVLRQVGHLILSHHGTHEWGSPVVPATLEAQMLHTLDMVDSRAAGFLDHRDRTAARGEWVEFSKMLGTELYVPDATSGG